MKYMSCSEGPVTWYYGKLFSQTDLKQLVHQYILLYSNGCLFVCVCVKKATVKY